MKRILYVACIMASMAALLWSCGGGGGGAAGGGGNGTIVISGATSTTNAFKPSAQKVTDSILMGAGSTTLYSSVTVTSVKIKATRFYLAESNTCSNPILVEDKSGSSAYQDLMLKPTMFTGSIPAGTYNCMIIQSSDLFKFTTGAGSDTTNGACTAGVENSFDIYKTENPVENWYNIVTGQTTTGSGSYGAPYEQDVTIFATTGTITNIQTAYPQVINMQALQLLTPLVITAGGSTNAAFVVDPSGRVSVMDDGINKYCWLEGVTMQFVTQ